MTPKDRHDAITAADLVCQETEHAASVAQDEVSLAAKRSRVVAWRYMNGLATAAESEAAIRAVMNARHAYLTAALRADGAAIVRLTAMEEDRLVRQAEQDAIDEAKKTTP